MSSITVCFGFQRRRMFLLRSLVFAICYLSCFVLASHDFKLSPRIIEPKQDVVVVAMPNLRTVTLRCDVSQTPTPYNISWLLNGEVFEDSQYRFDGKECKILFHDLIKEEYQFVLMNSYGAVISPKIQIKKAKFPDALGRGASKNISVHEHDKLILDCANNFTFFPPPTYTWQQCEKGNSIVCREFKLSGKGYMDDDGKLYIPYVNKSFFESGYIYKCLVRNKLWDKDIGGIKHQITVKEKNESSLAINLMLKTGSNVIVLERGMLTLKCLFSGFPLPNVTWKVPDGVIITKRHALSWTIDIFAANDSVAGVYSCHVSDDASKSHYMNVTVGYAPKFRNIADGPYDRNVTVGDDVTINCSPHANPPVHRTTWFKDGKQFESLPLNLHLSENSRNITITSVLPQTRLIVIQCYAENAHGAIWSTGYIHFLKRTKAVVSPESVKVPASTTNLSFNCSGSSDDATLVRILWYNISNEPSLLRSFGDVILSADNKTLTLSSDDLRTYEGNYSCHVTNGYSVDVKNFTIRFMDESAVKLRTSESNKAVFAVAFVLLLLILFLMLAFICYRNQRYATYLVDKKERENGNEPEKELERNGFLVYSRPERKPNQGSRLSLISSGISYGNVSMSEYGDAEAGKYDEDGSFIGNYRVDYK